MSFEVGIKDLNAFAIYLNGLVSGEHLSSVEIFLAVFIWVELDGTLYQLTCLCMLSKLDE